MSMDTQACGRRKRYTIDDDGTATCVPKDYKQSFDAKDGKVNIQDLVASIKEDIEKW